MTLCLIVDASKEYCEKERKIVEELGLEVEVVHNGHSALSICEKRIPEIIIIDVDVPKLDGIGFLRGLHKMMGGRSSYIIVCTAKSDPSTIGALKREGIHAFILKPFEGAALREKIKASGHL